VLGHGFSTSSVNYGTVPNDARLRLSVASVDPIALQPRNPSTLVQ
jgi:hypothetical protein